MQSFLNSYRQSRTASFIKLANRSPHISMTKDLLEMEANRRFVFSLAISSFQMEPLLPTVEVTMAYISLPSLSSKSAWAYTESSFLADVSYRFRTKSDPSLCPRFLKHSVKALATLSRRLKPLRAVKERETPM